MSFTLVLWCPLSPLPVLASALEVAVTEYMKDVGPCNSLQFTCSLDPRLGLYLV